MRYGKCNASGKRERCSPIHGKKSAVLHFNLACYHAPLGELEKARERLGRACKLEPKFKKEALADPDLAALWV